ncbi:MAG: FAD:protein FMN transferase [Actinomycetota bacterium]
MSGPSLSPLRRNARLMGTIASVHVYDDLSEDQVDAAVSDALAELERLEQMFSTFRADSVISQVNRGDLNVLDAPPEVIEVLDACTWLEHASNGAFSARREDGSIDPAGFVKGWACERGAARLAASGLSNFMFTIGGDLMVHGEPAPGQLWTVAIADPLHPDVVTRSIDIVDGAVATSGTSERGNHIRLVPTTDNRSNTNTNYDNESPLLSLTVIGPSLTWADAFATAAFAMGHKGLEWVAQFVGYEAIAIDRDGEVTTTAGFTQATV